MENNTKNIDLIIRLLALGLLATWCFVLLRPFIAIILWGAILAIAQYPIYSWLTKLLKGHSKLAGTVLTLLGIAIIIGPVSVISTVFVGNAQDFGNSLIEGTFVVPPPPDGILDWPVVGERIHNAWQQASVNLGALLGKFTPQLQQFAKNLLYLAANTGLTLLKFLLSIIIAGILMINADPLNRTLTQLSLRLAPRQGQAFVQLSASTIRGVTRGIIGVSVVQTLMVGIGFVVAGIPAAGLLAPLCLVLSIIQIGPGLVVIPTLIFAWSTMGTFTAILYTVWMIPAMLIDNILKPILMARGLPVPMIVILIGVLGGTLAHGIVGLFIGPVILSLGYELLCAWMNPAYETKMSTQKPTE